MEMAFMSVVPFWAYLTLATFTGNEEEQQQAVCYLREDVVRVGRLQLEPYYIKERSVSIFTAL